MRGKGGSVTASTPPDPSAPGFAQWQDRVAGQPGRTTQCGTRRQRYLSAARCNAYPAGIPLAILTDRVDHHQPVAGDRGIQWTPKPPIVPDGPITFAWVHWLPPGGQGRRTIGVLWHTPANDAIWYEPLPGWEQTPQSWNWYGRCHRGGPSIRFTAQELFAGWLDRTGSWEWSTSEPDTADSLDSIRAVMAGLAGG